MIERVTILGSGTCAVTPGRGPAGIALAHGAGSLLMDAGTGSMGRLQSSGHDYRSLTAVLLSHHHPDHLLDTLALFQALNWTPGYRRVEPLVLFAPKPAIRFLEAAARDLGVPPAGWDLQVLEARDGAVLMHAGLSIESVAVPHCEGSVGFRLTDGERTISYTGDTGADQVLVDLARGADLFICECSRPDDSPLGQHLSPREIAPILRKAHPHRTALMHFYPDLDADEARHACARESHGEVLATHDGHDVL